MNSATITPTGEATGAIFLDNLSPVRVFGTKKIRETFDIKTIDQARNARKCPGVSEVVLTPDAHVGYGAPVGCVMASPSHIYPGPVGVDINCSMSLLQFNLSEEVLKGERKFRRSIIQAIEKRIPSGYGNNKAPLRRKFSLKLIEKALIEGATPEVCEQMGIPTEWISRCEDGVRVGHDGTKDALAKRLEKVKELFLARKGGIVKNYEEKLLQIGSYGGGNHFGECEIVRLSNSEKEHKSKDGPNVANAFGLKDGSVAFLSHCGSRGFGNLLARNQFRLLKNRFEKQGIPIPAGDPELVYAPLGTPEADDYIDDMILGANFATINHLVINTLLLEAFQEIIPGVQGNLVYYISHNIARREIVDHTPLWIHRKGATRAYPANHFSLRDTPFAETGHPILLPGNPIQGSAVMVALDNARNSLYSVNHGAGRALGRRVASRTLEQTTIDNEFDQADVLTNCRFYPLDEAPIAYKDFNEVIRSVELAGLAREVARLQARFVIKDSATPDD